MPTCNLLETIHNKWLQASGNKMVDLYFATVDNYNKATLQSNGYFNFLNGGRSGTELSTSELKLRLASQISNPSKIAKLVDDVSDVVGLNTCVPHLEGERVFGSAKQKLDLPPEDESDSHRHDCVNYSVSKLLKKVSPSQSRIPLSVPSNAHSGRSTKNSSSHVGVVRTKTGFPIIESSYTKLMSWRIECISASSFDLCRRHSASGVKCNVKIAKY